VRRARVTVLCKSCGDQFVLHAVGRPGCCVPILRLAERAGGCESAATPPAGRACGCRLSCRRCGDARHSVDDGRPTPEQWPPRCLGPLVHYSTMAADTRAAAQASPLCAPTASPSGRRCRRRSAITSHRIAATSIGSCSGRSSRSARSATGRRSASSSSADSARSGVWPGAVTAH
jgi:hypothetical protein